MKQRAEAMSRQITKTVNCRYLLYLPKGYGRTKKRWPMILFLHGKGERGDDLKMVKQHGPPKIVERKILPFIVVSPQCPSDKVWTGLNDELNALLDEMAEKYAVDSDRIYLTGLSMGGYGTWSLASEHPERFAAIVPICGGGHRDMAKKLVKVPVWAFHGENDTIVPLSQTAEIVDSLTACGGGVKFTIYPKTGHDAWTVTYNNPKLYAWLLKHRRRKK